MSHLFLIGFMGAGKSTVGRMVAERLGRPFIDLDELVEQRDGATVPEIFSERGEEGFRAAEHEALQALALEPDSVVATGGGVVLREDNRAALRRLGQVVYLAVTPEEAIARLGDASGRPLLAGGDVDTARAILDARLALYTSAADHVVDTVGRDVDCVVDDVASIAGRPQGDAAIDVVQQAPEASYAVVVGSGLLQEAGVRVRDVTGAQRVALVTDENVFELYGQGAEASCADAGLAVSTHVVAPGERSKSLSQAEALLESFAAEGIDRASCVVALGGGVVGDLAGFCAAVYMRGIPVVHVPTTLLAQVDSSIGGKTGVDLPSGKNLVGAFWPPRGVIADVDLLGSLPAVEWTNGLVEMAKAALLAGKDALARFEDLVPQLLAREKGALIAAVREAAVFKAGVVSADPYELGLRECLNLGHTLGHALETLGGYDVLPHGLAVAEGMRFASSLSVHVLGAPQGLVERVDALLASVGASRQAFLQRARPMLSDLEGAQLLKLIKGDKKARSGVVRFVLLEGPGKWRAVPLDDAVAVRSLDEWLASVREEA